MNYYSNQSPSPHKENLFASENDKDQLLISKANKFDMHDELSPDKADSLWLTK